jgi:hypothetical protein
LPSWWFSWKNCHFVGRFFDFVIILRPITMYQDYLFFSYCPWPLSVRLQRKLHPWMDDGTDLGVASPRRPKSFHI